MTYKAVEFYGLSLKHATDTVIGRPMWPGVSYQRGLGLLVYSFKMQRIVWTAPQLTALPYLLLLGPRPLNTLSLVRIGEGAFWCLLISGLQRPVYQCKCGIVIQDIYSQCFHKCFSLTCSFSAFPLIIISVKVWTLWHLRIQDKQLWSAQRDTVVIDVSDMIRRSEAVLMCPVLFPTVLGRWLGHGRLSSCQHDSQRFFHSRWSWDCITALELFSFVVFVNY